MKRIFSCILTASMIFGIISNVSASELTAWTYEDFNYGVGNKLNTVLKAAEADEEKGFASGWKGDENLASDVIDSYVVGEYGMLESKPSNSGIYRQLKNCIDLAKDGIYAVSWDMMANSGTLIMDPTKTQRFFILEKGVSTNTKQLQIGFIGRKETGGLTPYMRALSNLYYSNRTVNRSEVYHLLVLIEASASENDKISYMVYSGDTPNSTFDLSHEAALNNTFDMIGYMGYTGGNNNNAVGNIAVEFYGEEQKAIITDIEAAISGLEADFSESNLNSVVNDISSLPDGSMKKLLSAKLDVIREKLLKAEEISSELEEIENETVTIDNIYYITDNLIAIREEIDSVEIKTEKEKLIAEYEAVRKNVYSKIISAARAKDDFSDTQDGWIGGYTNEAGEEISDLVIENGNLILEGTKEVYRTAAYPVIANNDFNSYVRIVFTLENEGKVFVNIGNIKAEFAENASLTYNEQTVASDVQLEKNKEYTAVICMEKEQTQLVVFESDSYYSDDNAISLKIGEVNTSAIAFGGENAKISDIIKENVGIVCMQDAKNAVDNMVSTAIAENIETAKTEVDKLDESVIKELFAGTIAAVEQKIANIIPEIRSVGISGTGEIGRALEAVCQVDDKIQNLKEINYTWYCGSRVVSNESTFIPQNSHKGINVYCEVTVTNTAGNTSEPFKSSLIKIVAASGGIFSGGGGGGGSASSSGMVIKTPVYFEEEKSPEDDDLQSDDNVIFDDITSHWAKENIEKMVAAGVAKGVSATEFKPEAFVTRAEFVTFLSRALKLDKADKAVEFSDVSSNDWFYSSVLAASDYVEGWDGMFHPYENITREAMAKIIVTACKESFTEQSSYELNFADIGEMSDWSVEYIKTVCAEGIFEGDNNNCFAPKKNATRAEALTVISKLLDIVNK